MNNKEQFLEVLRTVNREGIDKLIEWLDKKSTFFVDPASAIHHSNFVGGLCEHSFNVYKRLKEITGQDTDTIKIVGLLHDICKTGSYETYSKNVKDARGMWNAVTAYKHKKSNFPFGHGEKSVYMIQQFIKLTKEEALAIRWHMGAYEPKETYGDLAEAQKECPLVIYAHAADMLAAYVDEKVAE